MRDLLEPSLDPQPFLAVALEPSREALWGGIPAAAICTDLFIPNGQAIAEAHGAPDYPFALVPHPLASASHDEMAREAKQVLPAVLRLLLCG